MDTSGAGTYPIPSNNDTDELFFYTEEEVFASSQEGVSFPLPQPRIRASLIRRGIRGLLVAITGVVVGCGEEIVSVEPDPSVPQVDPDSPPRSIWIRSRTWIRIRLHNSIRNLIGHGRAPNQRLHLNQHVTVTPDGVVKVTADNFHFDCS